MTLIRSDKFVEHLIEYGLISGDLKDMSAVKIECPLNGFVRAEVTFGPQSKDEHDRWAELARRTTAATRVQAELGAELFGTPVTQTLVDALRSGDIRITTRDGKPVGILEVDDK
jgi:hypothetical protein